MLGKGDGVFTADKCLDGQDLVKSGGTKYTLKIGIVGPDLAF